MRGENENGFTVVELLVAIAILIFNGHQRLTQIATLQSDFRNSINNIINPVAPLTFNTEAKFLELSITSSDKNILGITLYEDSSVPVACVWGIRKFSDTDIVPLSLLF